MFGLIPLYFVWKNLADLAFEHNRSRWGFGLLGIGVYVGSQFLFGFIVAIIMIANGSEISKGEELAITVGGIAVGIASVYLLHYLLKKSWKKQLLVTKDSQLLDDLHQI